MVERKVHMKNNTQKIASIRPLWFLAIPFALFCLYFLSRLNDPDYAMFTLPGRRLPAPIAALAFFALTIYCSIGYSLYRDRIVMRLFGLPIRRFSWEQTCAAEYVPPKEKWQRPRVKFRIKPKNPGHPYLNLSVPIPERKADEILVALEECLGTIWMPDI